MERAVLQDLTDLHHQVLVRHRTTRSGSRAPHIVQTVAMAVDGRPRHAPDLRYPLQAIDLADGGRDLAAHRLRGPHATCRVGWASTSGVPKGGRSPAARSWPRAARSLAIVRSPTFALRRPISSSRASAGRVFNDTSPAARKA